MKISLNVVVRDRANYVVVDDALPAGFEGLNPRFVTNSAGSVTLGTSSTGRYSRWWYPWWTFDHSDLRDDRMLLFADYLPAGVYTYAYTARATSIGCSGPVRVTRAVTTPEQIAAELRGARPPPRPSPPGQLLLFSLP